MEEIPILYHPKMLKTVSLVIYLLFLIPFTLHFHVLSHRLIEQQHNTTQYLLCQRGADLEDLELGVEFDDELSSFFTFCIIKKKLL